jgi:CubicO group peptidase (beta-lactamase class C family)
VDLEPFLDGLINSQIQNRDIAGAVVSVVRDGEVVLSKGYGFADFEKERRVSGDNTLFRPGSIAKLFTAVAVMQLVEAGRLDLDRDIREYLDFEIPRKFPEPITLRRILTHTAGFEESLKNLFGAGGAPMPHREYLLAHMPVQIFRPGTVPAYSNYAISRRRLHRRAPNESAAASVFRAAHLRAVEDE